MYTIAKTIVFAIDCKNAFNAIVESAEEKDSTKEDYLHHVICVLQRE